MRLTQVATTALIVLLGVPAWAQESPEKPRDPLLPGSPSPKPTVEVGDKPWVQGVSKEERELAAALFEEGNKLLKESLFVQASEKYREALSHWDHPAIYYNLALALVNLDQPLEVYDNLERAMKFGESALDSDKFDRANTFKTLVGQQLAWIDIRCDQPGVHVSLDGKLLYVSPGEYKGFVRAGERVIVATKDGYETTTETHVLVPEQKLERRINVYTNEELTRYTRKWDAWKPWVVVGGGAAVVAIGGFLHARAAKNFNDYDDGIDECGGCQPETDRPGLTDKRDTGVTQQRIAVGAYLLGGSVLAAGITLAYINRSQPYRIKPYDIDNGEIAVTPVISPDFAGVHAALSF